LFLFFFLFFFLFLSFFTFLSIHRLALLPSLHERDRVIFRSSHDHQNVLFAGFGWSSTGVVALSAVLIDGTLEKGYLTGLNYIPFIFSFLYSIALILMILFSIVERNLW
jgi:hypothetical protein